MNDTQIDDWLSSLLKYHGAAKLTLAFEFDDGSRIEHEVPHLVDVLEVR